LVRDIDQTKIFIQYTTGTIIQDEYGKWKVEQAKFCIDRVFCYRTSL